jgi:hypothetical protein
MATYSSTQPIDLSFRKTTNLNGGWSPYFTIQLQQDTLAHYEQNL